MRAGRLRTLMRTRVAWLSTARPSAAYPRISPCSALPRPRAVIEADLARAIESIAAEEGLASPSVQAGVQWSKREDLQSSCAVALDRATPLPSGRKWGPALVDAVPAGVRGVQSATTHGGFVNLTLQADAIMAMLRRMCVGAPDGRRAGMALVDFASPNMGKEMHVGHMRSAVIGDTIARLLEYAGWHVDRVSHVGDAGVPVALILSQYLHAASAVARGGGSRSEGGPGAPSLCSTEWAQRTTAELVYAWRASADGAAAHWLPSPVELSRVYAAAKAAATTADAATDVHHPAADATVQRVLQQLQRVLSRNVRLVDDLQLLLTHSAADGMDIGTVVSGIVGGIDRLEGSYALDKPGWGPDDRAVMRCWLVVCAASRAGFTPLFRSLGVSVQERGEHTYLPRVPRLLAALMDPASPNPAVVQTQGATAVFPHGSDKPPLLLTKADGRREGAGGGGGVRARAAFRCPPPTLPCPQPVRPCVGTTCAASSAPPPHPPSPPSLPFAATCTRQSMWRRRTRA
jgi:hypothetical protein